MKNLCLVNQILIMNQSDGVNSLKSDKHYANKKKSTANRSSQNSQSQADSVGMAGSIMSRKKKISAHEKEETIDLISESSETSLDQSHQSIQSSDDENLEDTRIQEKSTDERTIKNQLEFIKGIPKTLISIFNEKTDKNTLSRDKHTLWTNQTDQCAASTSNEVKIRKYTSSVSNFVARENPVQDILGKLKLIAHLVLNFDTLVGVLYLVLKIVNNENLNSFDTFVVPVLIIAFSILFRLYLKLKGDDRRHTLQCQFNYNFQKKFFKAKKKVAEKGEKVLRSVYGGQFAFDLWENLKIGDMIIVKQHQEFPADVLLLDSEYRASNERKNTTVDDIARATIQTLKEKVIVQSGSDTRYKIRCKQSFPGTVMKNRVVETQKVSPLQVVNSFTGNLLWEYNSQGFFCGSFKFTDGTGDYDIDTDNIIKRGSFLRSNHKLVCLVINVGEGCMSSLPKVPKDKKSVSILSSVKNWFWSPYKHEFRTHMRYARFISIGMILIFLILEGIQLTIPGLSGFQDSFLNSANKVQASGSFSTNKSSIEFFNWAIVVAILCTPLFCEVVFKALAYMQAYFAEWDLNLVPANLRFNNLNAMAKLPWISHLVTSLQTLEGNQIYKVTYFRVGDQRFYHQDNSPNEGKTEQNTQDISTQNQTKTAQEKTRNKDQNYDDSHLSFSTSDDTQFNFEYLPQQRNHNSYDFSNQRADLLRRTKADPDNSLFSDFVRILSVCHQATHKTKETILDQGPRLSHFRSFIEEEEAQLMFAKQFGCTFAYRKSQVLSVQNEERVERYEELAYLYLKLQDGRSKVNLQVLRPFDKSGVLVINLKGPVNGCAEAIQTHKGMTRQMLQTEAQRLESLGFNLQLFCQRELTKGESASFKQKLDSLNCYSKTFKEELKSLCVEYCNQMQILGMLGLQKVIPIRNALTLQDCIQNGVKVWLLSQYSKRKTVVNCNNLNLMMNNEQIEVFGRSEREIEESLRQCFNKIFETDNKRIQAQTTRADADEEDRAELQKQHANESLQGGLEQRSLLIRFRQFVEKLILRGSFGRKLSKNNFVENRRRRVLLVGSKTLLIIVRDENLMRVFISLALNCDLIIGSGVSPALKGRLSSEIVNFTKIGRDQNAGYVMSVIGSPEDRNLSQKAAADVCCFVMNRQNSKDIEINSDLTISHFYAITYLLFKHGSQLHRRVIVASRFHLRKSLFICMLFIAQYVGAGYEIVSQFKNYFLAIYLTIGFEILVLVTAALYESEAFQFLHRVNGQYKCNPTIKVVNINMIISQTVEIIFDLAVILYFANIGGNLSNILLPNGFTFSGEGYSTLLDILLILYTIPLFMKLPRINITTLTVLLLCVLAFCFFQIMNQDFESMQIFFTTPQSMFQLVFIVLLFGLKFEVKRIMRRINPFQSRWDNFNSYVDERLELEQYESWEQLKFIDLENSYNADRLIDVQFVQDRRNQHIITQNLIKLPKRTELTDIIFEQMSQTSKRRAGQSNQMKLAAEKNQKGIGIENQKFYRESNATIDPINLNFKQVHQEQEFVKYNLSLFANDKQHLKDFTQQLSWLAILFAGLLIQTILRKFLILSDQNEPSNDYIFHVLNLIVCIVAIVLVRINLVTRKDYVILAVLLMVFTFTVVQTELNTKLNFDLEHNITIAVIVSFAFINRTIHSRYVLLLSWAISLWCLSLNLRLIQINGPVHQLITSTNEKISASNKNFALNLKTHYYLYGIPVFTFVWSIYVYLDEMHRKTTFLVLNRRIKEFKFLKQLIQRLVPESIRKYADVRSNNAAVDLLRNFTIIVVKVKNYDQLVSNSNDQMQVYNTLQLIQKAIQKVAQKHGVFLVNSIGERFVFVCGVKAFEKNISQKVLSVHHTHRACKFSIDLLQSTKEISRSNGVTVLFHVGINSPPHIACGIIGDIRPSFTMIGTGLLKAQEICDRAQAMQICLSKETYDMLGLFGVNLNIKVNGTTTFFQSRVKEIVYELLARHKTSRVKMRPLARYNQGLGLQKVLQKDNQDKLGEQNADELLAENRVSDVLSSSHGSVFSSLQQSDSDISGQLQSVMTFNSETRIDNSDATYIQTDYQFQMGSEFKDDQEISSNPVMNATYKLVQRNSWLLSFSNSLESKFLWQLYFELQQQNIIFNFLLLLCIFLGIAIIFTNLIASRILWLQLIWIIFFGMTSYISQSRITKISESKVYYLEYLQTAVALLFVAAFIANSFVNPYQLSYNAFTQIALISLVVFQGQRGWRFKNYFFFVIIVCATLIANQIYFLRLQSDPFPKIGEIICSVVIAGIFIHHSNSREVIQRINYNLNMLLSVEDIKNEDYIKRLLPAQSIVAIKKDEEFLQHLVDSTVLICTLHGFTDFLSQEAVEEKPHIGHQFIKAVYNKFDLLVEHNNQYKLQANCRNYILMSNPSYTTEINTELERTTQAYKVIQIGQAMIQAVQDTKKQWIELMAVQKEQVDFSNIGIRIVITTGELLGYISGTTFLQYEVFGETLIHGLRMLDQPPKDALCMSESTKKLLDSQTYISVSLDSEFYKEIDINEKTKIKTYLVKVQEKVQSEESEELSAEEVNSDGNEKSLTQSEMVSDDQSESAGTQSIFSNR